MGISNASDRVFFVVSDGPPQETRAGRFTFLGQGVGRKVNMSPEYTFVSV